MENTDTRSLRDIYVRKLGQAETAMRDAEKIIERIKSDIEKLDNDYLYELETKGLDCIFIKNIDYDKLKNSKDYQETIMGKIVLIIKELKERLDENA